MINLTQDFVFETDSLESLTSMINTIVPILFSEKRSQYTKLHLKTKQPSSFDDGKYENYNWDKKKPVLFYQGKHHLLDPSLTYGGPSKVFSTEKTVGSKSADDATAASCADHSQLRQPKPTRMWIATLADYMDEETTNTLNCASFKDLVKQALKEIKKSTLVKDFFSKYGSGYTSWFNSDDGSVDKGFRLTNRHTGAWNNLDISLIHLYYGK